MPSSFERRDHIGQPSLLMSKVRRLFLGAAGPAIEGQAKLLCPVDIGTLRSSITHRVDGDRSVEVGSDMPYAADVEFGQPPGGSVDYQALREWAGRVIGDPEAGGAVARHIELHGTKAQKFLRRALDEFRKRGTDAAFRQAIRAAGGIPG